jgi:hypothetical protein
VRVLSDPLTDYERYSCEFGYAYNVPAGEDVRVVRPNAHAMPEGLERTDFWIINDVDAVLMHYDERGRFRGATPAPEELDRLRRLRDAAWLVAEPFDRWWARHPELHRRSVIS